MSIFLTQKEIDFINHINRELISEVIKQQVVLYKIAQADTVQDKEAKFYGESSNKVFEPGVSFYALVLRGEPEMSSTDQTLSINHTIECYVQRQWLVDNNIYPQVGDFIFWDSKYHEINTVTEPQLIQGDDTTEHQVQMLCSYAGISQITIRERIK